MARKKIELTEEERTAQRAYLREWRKANPDKVRAHQRKFWRRQAEKASALKEGGVEDGKHI